MKSWGEAEEQHDTQEFRIAASLPWKSHPQPCSSKGTSFPFQNSCPAWYCFNFPLVPYTPCRGIDQPPKVPANHLVAELQHLTTKCLHHIIRRTPRRDSSQINRVLGAAITLPKMQQSLVQEWANTKRLGRLDSLIASSEIRMLQSPRLLWGTLKENMTMKLLHRLLPTQHFLVN